MSQAAKASNSNTDNPDVSAHTEDSGPWPRGVSREPVLSIGAVVDIIRAEFPATTVSKIRFLEDQGLVKPHRTNAGYRKYSRADIERIRFILAQQRDSYAPLKVIYGQLCALDSGHDVEPVPPARLVSSEGKLLPNAATDFVTARDLKDLTGCSTKSLEEYAKLGLITPDLSGHYPKRTVQLVTLLMQLQDLGIDSRLLRSIKSSADRSADIIDQSVRSRTRRDRPGEKERARAQASELGDLFADVNREFLALAIAALADS